MELKRWVVVENSFFFFIPKHMMDDNEFCRCSQLTHLGDSLITICVKNGVLMVKLIR